MLNKPSLGDLWRYKTADKENYHYLVVADDNPYYLVLEIETGVREWWKENTFGEQGDNKWKKIK